LARALLEFGDNGQMALWHRHTSLAYAAVLTGVFGHASVEFIAVLSGIAGPELSAWRFLLGGLGLVALALLSPTSRDLLTPLKTHFWPLMTLSLLGITLAYLVFHWSLDFATIPQVATAVTTIPIYVALINMVVNKQPISIAKVLSGICAILGVALLITDGYLTDLVSTSRNLLGVFMAIGCAAAVSAYSVLVRPIIVQYGALRITAITMMIGGIGLWLLVGWAFHIWVTPTRLVELSVTSLVSLLVIALWNTTITQFLWIGGLAALPDITRGSYLFFLKPVIAALLAVLILGQHITGVQILAIGVVCASVFGEVFLAKRSGVA